MTHVTPPKPTKYGNRDSLDPECEHPMGSQVRQGDDRHGHWRRFDCDDCGLSEITYDDDEVIGGADGPAELPPAAKPFEPAPASSTPASGGGTGASAVSALTDAIAELQQVTSNIEKCEGGSVQAAEGLSEQLDEAGRVLAGSRHKDAVTAAIAQATEGANDLLQRIGAAKQAVDNAIAHLSGG